MQLISKYKKEIRFVLCTIDIFSKYTWVVPLKGKVGTVIINAFQNFLDESGREPSKKWVEKCSKFYNRLMKSCFHDNDIEIYSTHNQKNLLLLKDVLEH